MRLAIDSSLSDGLPGDNLLSGDLPGEILLGVSFLLVFEGVIVAECGFCYALMLVVRWRREKGVTVAFEVGGIEVKETKDDSDIA